MTDTTRSSSDIFNNEDSNTTANPHIDQIMTARLNRRDLLAGLTALPMFNVPAQAAPIKPIRLTLLGQALLEHDLRTQVTKLRLRLELLDASPTRDRAVADIEAMQALIEETLEFAAAASGPMPP